MGGFGSGSRKRLINLDSEHELLSLDINLARKLGVIDFGNQRHLVCSMAGGGHARIDTVCSTDTVWTTTKIFDTEEVLQATIYHHLLLSYSNQNLGGRRAWFKCEGCWNRYGKLYCAQNQWRCRKCLNLRYESQRISKGWRALYKSDKIRAKIGDLGTGFSRPKGMHKSRYKRMMMECMRAEYQALSVLNPNLKRQLDDVASRLISTNEP